MAGTVMTRIPMSNRISAWGDYKLEGSGDLPLDLSDLIFGFLEEQCEISPNSTGSNDYGEKEEKEEDEEEAEENLESVEDKRSFWETQHQQLQATLYRTTSLESGIRSATKEAIRAAQLAGNVCTCRRPISGGCRDCLMREICGRLQNSGYNSAICKSKWKNSPDIPSGEHTFLDVVDNSNPKKGEVRVIIELNFHGEFEMARASEEYNRLVSKLPEVFVGKIERLLALIKILCTAAKKCMKEQKMHLGPWRKHKYMQAKWIRVSERKADPRPFSTEYSRRPNRPRTSMLTMDLLEKLPTVHCTAVHVL